MLRFCKNIAFFFGIVVLIFAGLNVYQSNRMYEPSVSRKYDELLSKSAPKDTINGIIIGNSKVAYSLRPSVLDQTGVKYYNHAMGRANLSFYQSWFSLLFTEYKRPIDHCIIAVDRYLFQPPQKRVIEQDAEYLSWSSFWNLLSEEEVNTTSLFLNKFAAFKYRKQLLSSFSKSNKKDYFKTAQYDHGFIPFERPFNPAAFKRFGGKEFTIATKKKNDFENILKLLLKKDIEIYLVMPPEYNFPDKATMHMKSYLDSIQRNDKVTLFDFNNEYAVNEFNDPAHFSDPQHLNSRGSILLSQALVKAINDHKKTKSID